MDAIAFVFVIFVTAIVQVKTSNVILKNFVCNEGMYKLVDLSPSIEVVNPNNHTCYKDHPKVWSCDHGFFKAQKKDHLSCSCEELRHSISFSNESLISNMIFNGYAEAIFSVFANVKIKEHNRTIYSSSSSDSVSARVDFSPHGIPPQLECDNIMVPSSQNFSGCFFKLGQVYSEEFQEITTGPYMRIPNGTRFISIVLVGPNSRDHPRWIGLFKEPLLSIRLLLKMAPGMPKSATAVRNDTESVNITWTLPEIHKNFDNAFSLVEVLRVELNRTRLICSGSNITKCIDKKSMNNVLDHVDTLHYIVVVSNAIGETRKEIIADEWAYSSVPFFISHMMEATAMSLNFKYEKRFPPVTSISINVTPSRSLFFKVSENYTHVEIYNGIKPNTTYLLRISVKSLGGVSSENVNLTVTTPPVFVDPPYIRYFNRTAIISTLYSPSRLSCYNVSLLANTNVNMEENLSIRTGFEIIPKVLFTIELEGLKLGDEFFFQMLCIHEYGSTLSPIVTMNSCMSPPLLDELTMNNVSLTLDNHMSQWLYFVEVFAGNQKRIRSGKTNSSYFFLDGLVPSDTYSVRYYDNVYRRWSRGCTIRNSNNRFTVRIPNVLDFPVLKECDAENSDIADHKYVHPESVKSRGITAVIAICCSLLIVLLVGGAVLIRKNIFVHRALCEDQCSISMNQVSLKTSNDTYMQVDHVETYKCKVDTSDGLRHNTDSLYDEYSSVQELDSYSGVCSKEVSCDEDTMYAQYNADYNSGDSGSVHSDTYSLPSDAIIN